MIDPVKAESTYVCALEMVQRYQRLWPNGEKRALVKALYGEPITGAPARFGDPWYSSGPDFMTDIMNESEPDLNQHTTDKAS